MGSNNYGEAITRLKTAVSEEERFYALTKVALLSFNEGKFDESRKYAEDLQDLTPQFMHNWNYGNAIQNYNIVLGRLAVRDGKLEIAKIHLLQAGKSPGSPQMMTFGPNMSLAKDLLEKGERNSVLEYFNLCKNFWKNENGELDKWASAVRKGDIPTFGANLFY